jgi:hypothetical protein
MPMTIEEIIDLQEAGSRARILGLPINDNPFSSAELHQQHSGPAPEILERHNAWRFGWEVENASRHESVVRQFRELALSVKYSRD